MKYSSLKENGKAILSDARETASYAVHSPLSFSYEALLGTALIAEDLLLEKEKKMPRLYDDRCKNCAKLAMVGFLALAVLVGGLKTYRDHRASKRTIPAVQLERE